MFRKIGRLRYILILSFLVICLVSCSNNQNEKLKDFDDGVRIAVTKT